MTLTNKEIAARFANAVKGAADPDFADLFADKVIMSHIYDEAPVELDGSAIVKATLNDEAGFRRVMPDYKPADVRVFYSDEGFAVERTVAGTLANGVKVKYPFCACVTVKDGKIVKIDAYQDRQQAAPIGEAMHALAAAQASS